MNIVVDRNIRASEPTFGQHARLRRLDGRSIRRADLKDVDALIVRTATRVDEALLAGTPVGFVGSTSIGTDHMDIPWLERNGITWANAPGCNADSAAQYTVAMIWLACARLDYELPKLTAGIVGRGNVGSRVVRLLRGLGLRVVANDPPLAEAGEMGLVPLEEALSQDIVCLHVPLTREGQWPTHHLIDRNRLARMHRGALLVNTARGDVVNGAALLAELQTSRLQAALDVWPGEPDIDAGLLRATCVATPHVAGYSEDGRRLGTLMVYDAFCRWAGLVPASEPPALPQPPALHIRPGENALASALDAACFVSRHDSKLRELAALSGAERAAGFDRLRREYPSRRDFEGWRIATSDPEAARQLCALGFRAMAPALPQTV